MKTAILAIALLASASASAGSGYGGMFTESEMNRNSYTPRIYSAPTPAPVHTYRPAPSYSTKPNIFGGTTIRNNSTGSSVTGTPNIFGGQDFR